MRPALLAWLLVSCNAASLHRTAEDSSNRNLEQLFPSLAHLANLVAAAQDAERTPSVPPGVQLLHSRFGVPTAAHGVEHSSGSAVEGGSGDTGRDEGMFKLPPLPYAYNALEPHIDAETMKFHHDFHQKTYVDKLNEAMSGKEKATLVELMPEARESEINNALGGTYNHCLFFSTMAPPSDGGGAAVEGALATAIDEVGSYDQTLPLHARMHAQARFSPHATKTRRGIWLLDKFKEVEEAIGPSGRAGSGWS